MKRRFTGLAIGMALVAQMGLVVPVLAQEQTAETTSINEVRTMTEEAVRERSEEAKKKAAEAREEARKKLEAQKSKVEERTKEARTKSCEARKANIDKRLNNISSFGERHKGTFEAILNRVEEFKTTNNLTVENEADLKAAIDTAKMSVEDQVAALDELKGTIDCTDPDTVATSLEAFKEQSGKLRESLKTYREAIREYMQAVKKSAEAVTESEDGVSEESSTQEGVQQ